MRRGNQGNSSSSPNCDVGLGLRMHSDGGTGTGTGTGAGASFLGYYSSDNIHGGFIVSGGGGGGGGMGDKCVLSASQWEELERQKMIHKYIMASIPVPPELLKSPPSPSPSPSPSVSHCNSLDLRYSSGGSDAEPWRCKRTDGKKWRCSRDVAPDHKYCDRHAHKSKPRSRKHVEPSPHQQHQQAVLHPSPHAQLPRLMEKSAVSHNQSRRIEWFAAATNSSNELKSGNLGGYDPCNSIFGSKIGSLETKSFVDGWDNKGLDGLINNTTKLSPNSLTLSMPGIDEDNQDSSCSNIGMIMMTPGGPLGEALCLGNTSTRGGGMNVASPHHCSSKSSCEDDSHALNFIE